jgi:Zn-dependent peptidase ImmA (M78 family)/DNA-binding XRE family transcriptional regulator
MERFYEVAENVKRLRYVDKLTQRELACRSGVSLPTIKNVEKGKPGTKIKTIEAIAKALGVSLENLLKPVRRLRTIRFRSCKYMRSREGVIAVIVNKLDRYNDLETLLDNYMPTKFKELSGNKSDPVTLAAKVREALGLSETEAISDIVYAMNLLGVKLLNVSVETGRFYGLSVGEADGGPAVIVNKNSQITFEQTVFAIAHELGHLLMHSNNKNVDTIWAEEDEADLFASHFLLPEAGFRYHWDRSEGLHWTDKVIKIKQIYAVHSKTILTRFGNSDTFKKLSKQFRDYFKITNKREPFKTERIIFTEERLTALVIQAVKRKIIPLETAVKILDFPAEDVLAHLEEPELYQIAK